MRGGPMRIIAFMTQAAVIDQIPTHLRTRAAREAHAGPRIPLSMRDSARRGTSLVPRAPAAPRAWPRRPATTRGALAWVAVPPEHQSGPPPVSPPTVTAVLTAHEAPEGGGGHAAACLSVLARSAITPYTRPTPIEFPMLLQDVRIPVVAGIRPLVSAHNAEFLANQVPGVTVPREVLDRRRKANDKSKEHSLAEGIVIARAALAQERGAV